MGGCLFYLAVGYISGAVLMWYVVTADAAAIETTYADHTRAVELARADRHAEGLALLRPLLARFPDDYPLNRDAILIATWAGDCDYALERYAYVRTRPQIDSYLVTPLSECAVRQARAGDYDAGASVLHDLVGHAPEPYPVLRDLALIAVWKGDCGQALQRFESIRDDARNESYLLVPMIDCQVREGRASEAEALIEQGLARYPDDEGLRQAALRVQVARRLDEGIDPAGTLLQGSLVTDDSQPGPREWRSQLLLSAGIAPTVRAHARLLATAASDDGAGTGSGDMRRGGLGIGWRPGARWELMQELSTDLRHANQDGSTTRVNYRPYQTLTMSAAHATFAEDLPLRARINGIEASNTELSAAYHRLDYVWETRASANRYDFTDGNRRQSLYGSLGYAYQMLPEREQRIYLEAYRSRNTLDGAPYFNPRSDQSLGITHRTTFVFDSRYKRHVDSLYVSVAQYRQDGFGTKPRWGVKYEQGYDFDDDLALTFGISLQRNVYDGQHENAMRGEIHFRRRF